MLKSTLPAAGAAGAAAAVVAAGAGGVAPGVGAATAGCVALAPLACVAGCFDASSCFDSLVHPPRTPSAIRLRSRVVQCLWVFFGGFVACYFASDRFLAFLRKPLFDHLPLERQHLYYTGLFENFFVHLRIAGYASLILLSPVYFMLLWGFIAPGLHPHERKQVLPFAIGGSVFFLLGSGFAYFVLFPAGVKYFLTYGTQA
ncbi:MAG: twin-arginine translocase subunit TatC, partial [Deltaproteobacteria bacterium]|nr:twin-arginine translocase subunit TatC [Deltaproteobacteria bacterium]